MSDQTSKGLLKTYIIGLVLCVVITLISFWMTGNKILDGRALIFAIAGLALIQFFVQLKCFLHLSLKPDARWDVISLVFTIIIVLILVAGSLWIMFDMAHMMMP